MDRIGLAETIEALRAELAEAASKGHDAEIRFRFSTITLDFHVGVTRDVGANAGVKFWVVELGGSGSYATETIQRVSVTIEPIRSDGRKLDLTDRFD